MQLEVFLKKSRKVHGDKYDYSKVLVLENCRTKVPIICPVVGHGLFWQRANTHYLAYTSYGCPKCGVIKKAKSKREAFGKRFVARAKSVHGQRRYDYSLVKYTMAQEKVLLKCNLCGAAFLQRAYTHLQGAGCRACGNRLRQRAV